MSVEVNSLKTTKNITNREIENNPMTESSDESDDESNS